MRLESENKLFEEHRLSLSIRVTATYENCCSFFDGTMTLEKVSFAAALEWSTNSVDRQLSQ